MIGGEHCDRRSSIQQQGIGDRRCGRQVVFQAFDEVALGQGVQQLVFAVVIERNPLPVDGHDGDFADVAVARLGAEGRDDDQVAVRCGFDRLDLVGRDPVEPLPGLLVQKHRIVRQMLEDQLSTVGRRLIAFVFRNDDAKGCGLSCNRLKPVQEAPPVGGEPFLFLDRIERRDKEVA